MRKSLIALVGLAFVWAASNLYACDGKTGAAASKAGAATQKSELRQAGNSCESGAKDAAAVKTGEAKYMTTESHSCPYMNESTQKTGAAGSCCISKEGQAAPDKANIKAKSSSASVEKEAKKINPLLILSAPVELSSTVQK